MESGLDDLLDDVVETWNVGGIAMSRLPPVNSILLESREKETHHSHQYEIMGWYFSSSSALSMNRDRSCFFSSSGMVDMVGSVR